MNIFKKIANIFTDIDKKKEEVNKLVEDFRKEVKGVEEKLPPKLLKTTAFFDNMIIVEKFSDGSATTKITEHCKKLVPQMDLDELLTYAEGLLAGNDFNVDHNINGRYVTGWDRASAFQMIMKVLLNEIGYKISEEEPVEEENNEQN